MTPWGLMLRGLRHHWRTHVGVVLGAACATAALVGALSVGDSVRLSLRHQARMRVGRVDAALRVRDRFFRSDLGRRLAAGLGQIDVAAALNLAGTARVAQGPARAGIVDVFGVQRDFFALSPKGQARAAPGPGQAYLSPGLAAQLGVGIHDHILLRVEKPSFLPRDMLMATIEDISLALPLEVAGVIDDEDFGRFSMRASQIAPFNLFVSLTWLQAQLDLQGRANMILLGNSPDGAGLVARADRALRECWTLADAQIHVKKLRSEQICEVSSERVFIERSVVEAIARVQPGLLGVLTYFVNGLGARQRVTPYSMVSAVGPLVPTSPPEDPALRSLPELLPGDLGDRGIVLNSWLAQDLQARVGDEVKLSYFVMGPQLVLGREEHTFSVRSVVPLKGAADDPGLMPRFPGLADTEHCRDWEPGLPIDLKRIRPADEQYWDAHRGTPKAFISLPAGQALWGNRFGSLTAIRGPASLAETLAKQLPGRLDPARLGLFFQDLRGPALTASQPTTDFGGLFFGLSFFLILAALLLCALLFVFGVEQRANEIGLLLSVGFRPARVRRLFLLEGLLLATLGAVLGVLLGMAYTRGVLWALSSLWADAVGQTNLTFHASLETLGAGALGSILAAACAMALALRKSFRRPVLALLQSRGGIPAPALGAGAGRHLVSLWLSIAGALGAILLALLAKGSSEQVAGSFFGAGALLLISALALCRRLLVRLARPKSSSLSSLAELGLRNMGRRPGRSLTTIALLASGTFLVVAIQSFWLESPADFRERSSGTGGFALFARSSLPVLRDLGTDAGRDAFGLNAAELQGVSIVPLRVRAGDDASCLNLNLPQNPRLIGVQPASLAERGAFQFVDSLAPENQAAPSNPWLLLDADFGPDIVPAIGDQAVIMWSLHKQLGDDLSYRDEQGRLFSVRIVGSVARSILQGNLVISQGQFEQRFPSVSGQRMFLIDAPPKQVAAVSSRLTDALEDLGLEVTRSTDRLAAYDAVQNTYLLIFQALGALGLLLGSVGVGLVVLRNTLERRSELATLAAMGFTISAIRRLIWSEHALLLALGLGTGVLSALLAVLPGLLAAGSHLPLLQMSLFVLLLAASGASWVWLACTLSTRGPLLAALQEE